MSIEALIQAHILSLQENTEAVKLLTLSLAGRTPAAEKPKAVKVAGLSEESVKILKDELKTEVVEKIDTDFDESKLEAVPYETVRALVLKLAPTQRDAIKALNAKHGIANLKVLLDKEDDFSTVNDQAKLEAVYADLQALEG
jgi:hypothetical protein